MFLRLRGLVNWFRSDVWFSLWVLPCFIFNNSSNSIGDVFIKKNVSRIFRFYWVIFILYTIFFFFDSIFRIGLAGVFASVYLHGSIDTISIRCEISCV